ncbi:17268_t:CDS:2, partial [Racocetra fulgida]
CVMINELLIITENQGTTKYVAIVLLLTSRVLLPGPHVQRLNESQEQKDERTKKLSEAINTIIECIGEDPKRQGLLKTPDRYAQALLYFSKGYEESIERYIPNRRVLGLSKLARIAEMFSRRLQLQERLTKQIAVTLQEILKPQVQKPGSSTTTSVMLGVFRDQAKTREEFLTLIKS